MIRSGFAHGRVRVFATVPSVFLAAVLAAVAIGERYQADADRLIEIALQDTSSYVRLGALVDAAFRASGSTSMEVVTSVIITLRPT